MLRAGAEAGDAGVVQHAAHTVKSSAGNLGAVHLQRSAEALESLAAAGTVDELLIQRTVEHYESSEGALRRVLQELEG